MATIEANLNEAGLDAWGGEISTLPPGEYQFKIKAADVESKEDGEKIKNQLVIDYEVVSGAFSGKIAKAWFNLDFTKDTPRKRLKSLVQAAGIAVSPNGSFDTAQLLGCKLNADVIHRTYEGKPDPVLGGPPPQKTAINIVNERPFREVVNAPEGAVNGAPSTPGTLPGVKVGGAAMPGLTKV